MKNYLFLLVILMLGFTGAFCQGSFVAAVHDINEVAAGKPVEIGGNYYFLSKQTEAGKFGQNVLYKYTYSGSQVYRQAPLDVPTAAVSLIKTLDNKLLVAGGGGHCDVVTQLQKNYIAKFDTAGNTVFKSTYWVSFSDKPVACLQRPDSGFFSFTDSLVISHDKNGVGQFMINLGITAITSALWLPNGTVLLSAKTGGTPSLFVMASNGVITTTLAAPVVFKEMTFYGTQKIVALGVNGALYKYSPSLNLLGQSAFAATQTVTALAAFANKFYVLQGSSANPNEYKALDTLFNVVYSFTNSLAKYSQTSLLIANSGSRVAILGDAVAHVSSSFLVNDEHRCVILNVKSLYGLQAFSEDLKLESVAKQQSYITFIPDVNFQQNNRVNFYLKARVKVKNKGNVPVTSFKLNCYIRQDVACGNYYYQELFTGFNLNPGDTMTVITSTFVERSFIPVAMGQSLTAQYCFYVSLPNKEPDGNLADNELCSSYPFIVTGLLEQAASISDLRVYPNPAADVVVVHSEHVLPKVSLVNSIGQTVGLYKLEAGENALHIDHLPAGIYFIKADTVTGVFVKKILKQ